MTPRPTRRQTEYRRDRNKAREFLTPRPTRRQKSTEETETKLINLR